MEFHRFVSEKLITKIERERQRTLAAAAAADSPKQITNHIRIKNPFLRRISLWSSRKASQSKGARVVTRRNGKQYT